MGPIVLIIFVHKVGPLSILKQSASSAGNARTIDIYASCRFEMQGLTSPISCKVVVLLLICLLLEGLADYPGDERVSH